MSKNLKLTLVLILVGCGGANSIDVISQINSSDFQTYANSVITSIGMLSFVLN